LQDFFRCLEVYLENIMARSGFHVAVIMVFCGNAGNRGHIQAPATHQKSSNFQIFRPALSQFTPGGIHLVSQYRRITIS
jgi:hypothetical protein